MKFHWTQGNAVPPPPVIAIQRSHTLDFIETLEGPQPPLGDPKLVYSSLTSDFPLKPLLTVPHQIIIEVDTLAVDGWAVAFGTARRGLGGAPARPVPSSL